MKEFYRIHELSGCSAYARIPCVIMKRRDCFTPRVEKTAIACTEFRT